MTTNIKPWGNSQGLYIPKQMLRQLNININDPVNLDIEDGKIVISKDNNILEKKSALTFLQQIRKTNTDIDYKEEFLNYLDERYGNA